MKITVYPSYLFRDHDPVIDKLHTLVADSGNSLKSEKARKKVSEASGVSASTLHNWHLRKTKRPQFVTIAAVVTALGGDIEFVYKGQRTSITGNRKRKQR